MVYNVKKLNVKQILVSFLLFALSIQVFSIGAAAQVRGVDKMSMPVDESTSKSKDDEPFKNKISPDLEEKADEAFNGMRSDGLQRVIIQLKSETSLNDMNGNDLSEVDQKELFDREIQANKEKAGILVTDMPRFGGSVKKSFNRLGLLTAELPLSKIRELSESETVAYISPDRETSANGHIETTTGASLVRNLISTTTPLDGQGIGVAVLDSGIDGSHVLTGAAPGENRPGVTFQKDFTMTCTYCWDTNLDVYGHGSHVATMLAGRGSFAGAAYQGIAPKVNLLNLKVLNGSGVGTASNFIAAIDWAIANKSAHNIRVMNISLGTPARDSYLNDPMCLAVRRAVNAGIVVVASAGNYGKDSNGNKLYGTINSPGIEPSAITVGAANTFGTDYRSDDAIATYSSKGPTRGYRTVNGVRKYDNLIKPDLVAPGNKLIGAQITYRDAASVRRVANLPATYPSLNAAPSVTDAWSQLMYLSGTSMAAPVVSGTVALMLQARPNLTPNLVKAILMYSAQPLNGYNTFEQGAGLLNADGALRITKLVKTTLPTTNGSALLSASLPTSQTSVIGGQTATWGKGVITNYGFLSGNDLMNKWQGMYALGVLVSDSTPFSGSSITRSTSLTNGTLSLYQGAITNNGVLVGDGNLFLSSNAMGSSPQAFVNSQGVLVSDGITINGVLVGDGVLVSDGVLVGDGIANSVFGDNTACMLPAP